MIAASAFSPSASHRRSFATPLQAVNKEMAFLQDQASKVMAVAVLTASLWSAPAISFLDHLPTNTAVAKEMASGSGSRVNKDPESLLRLGLPIDNKEVRQLQSTIEDIKTDVSSKRKAAALDGVKKARTQIKTKSSKITASCQDATYCTSLLNTISTELDPLEKALLDSQEASRGSEQERTALDKAYVAQTLLTKELNKLEENMVPRGYETPVPEEYNDLPQLKGRATVEFVLKKANGGVFDINGENFDEAKLVMVIDGYTAPVTGGNFVDLVNKGFYTKMDIQRSDGFVVQTGNPEGEADGYVGKPGKALGAGKHGERLIPLETFIKGDKGPFYETTMEDEGRGGQATVLPFSSYGAMGWAREEYDPNSGSSQFFWLLFDSDLTPAGKNVLDGRYPCFGYVVEGNDFLSDIKEGDIITSAKVTSGLDKLKLP